MYNQFILEELKTLNDLLNTGAITQGEFDHLKQILIDGTKAGVDAPVEAVSTENQPPDDAVKFYVNEAKTYVLYNQYDKAYSFIQKVLALKPGHREATRLKQEVKSHFQKDYFIGAALGVLLACGLSYLLTLEKDVNILLLCILPVAAGLILPGLANGLFIGRANRRPVRYMTSGLLVVVVALTANVLLANGLVELERTLMGTNQPVTYRDNTVPQPPLQENPYSGDTDIAAPGDGISEDSSTENSQPTPYVMPETTVPDGGETKTSVSGEDRVAGEKEDAIKDILKQYYKDYNKQRFDASKYFAQNVDRFINLKNTTPAEITDVIENEFYDEFQEAVSNFDPKTLTISKLSKGYYQADFEETMSCFRKSKEQHQYIRTKVKVIFDKDLKIRYSHQERLLESRFGVKAAAELDGKMVYTNQ